MAVLWWTVLVLLQISERTSGAAGSEEHNHTAVLQSLLGVSEGILRPNFNGKPVNVNCNVFVSGFDSVEEKKMDYTVLIYFRQRWNDPRLSYSDLNKTINLDSNIKVKMWVPDLFFVNEKDGRFHTITTDNRYIRIYPNGNVLYSTRLTLTLSCYMHLGNFPTDKQLCRIHIESYSYTTDDMTLEWQNDKALEISEEVKLPDYELRVNGLMGCTAGYTTEGGSGYFLIQIYLPSILIVIISWISFWIHSTSAPARVALAITTVLTLTTHSNSARAHMPRVSYITNMDIWMAACQAFVFAALLEYAVVNHATRREMRAARKAAKAAQNQPATPSRITDTNNPPNNSAPHYEMQLQNSSPALHKDKLEPISPPCLSTVINMQQSPCRDAIQPLPPRPAFNPAEESNNKIDDFCKVFFPVAFLIFNLVYWLYLNR
ncbi:LOW QUALITY PROTEIN: glycine receptor subunit alpha-3-like [Branchiostoma floridae]|uniref:LOW QUALITY PROTEIN: glycine receptor subunit alpha-3-like n=2 Tax=Branchiostoma floridae TaxID=7739 RepID=A0A9J7NBN6_BRAFL|nr:LOW QUALITY PROTEIN: glycine receptor subunit alpha-3-like [Branchiostoma floridae]